VHGLAFIVADIGLAVENQACEVTVKSPTLLLEIQSFTGRKIPEKATLRQILHGRHAHATPPVA
jgi:hypothetical protein